MNVKGATVVNHNGPQSSLHRLLDSVEKSHRSDIDTYCKGHLNGANLYKSEQLGQTRKPWTIFAEVQEQKSSTKFREPTKMQVSFIDSRLSEGSATHITRYNTRAEDGASSLKSSQLRQSPRLYKKKSDANSDDNGLQQASAGNAEPLSSMKDKNLQAFQRNVPMFLNSGAVTRKDHLKQMKELDQKIIRRTDQHERKAMSGTKAVEHLEKKLHEGLKQLPPGNYAKLNFNRLHVFSSIFDDLIGESNTLTFMLKTVKEEYDNYLAYLLDRHLTRQKNLSDQVEEISRKGDAVSVAMEDAIKTVDNLEDLARKELQMNEKLRLQLHEEAELKNRISSAETTTKNQLTRQLPEIIDTSDKLSSLRVNILEKMDNMAKLKNQLRNEFVLLSMCNDLEQCVRDTEIEIQTLMSQKDYFEKSITDLENELKRAIEAADTTERDARRIWKKIHAMTRSKDKSKNVSSTAYKFPSEDDSDEETENEHKWNWYIS